MSIRYKKMSMPKELGFITPTFMTVFELFLSDPMQVYHEREVVRRIKVSRGSANKILRLLAALGFLTRQTRGRMVLYRLNHTEAVVKQFKILSNVYRLKGLTDKIKEESRRIVLFGSCAEGTDTRESDIDLFVLTSAKSTVRRRIRDFNRASERSVTPVVVDTNELTRLKREDKPLYENMRRGIVLWEKE
jgi:predicted nucleotidyltransferase